MNKKRIGIVAAILALSLLAGSFGAFADGAYEIPYQDAEREAELVEFFDGQNQDLPSADSFDMFEVDSAAQEEGGVVAEAMPSDSGGEEADPEGSVAAVPDEPGDDAEQPSGETGEDGHSDGAQPDGTSENAEDDGMLAEAIPPASEDTLVAAAAEPESAEISVTLSDYRDDAEEYGTDKLIRLNSRDIRMAGYYDTNIKASHKNRAAFRFPGVAIPDDAVIDEAYIEFITRDISRNRTSNIEVRAELGDPAQYSTVKGSVSGRSYGSQVVRFAQDALAKKYTVMRTPNLKELIDENRQAGWRQGQALAFLLEGDNYIGSIYQGGTEYAPKLVVKYTVGGEGPGGPGDPGEPGDVRNVYVNELMTGQGGESWVELYNGNDHAVALEGFFLTDDELVPDKYPLPSVSISPWGFGLLDLEDGFALPEEAENLYLIGVEEGEYRVFDSFPLSQVGEGQTLGRFTDGGQHVVPYQGGTPGESNNQAVPVLRIAMSHQPGDYDEGFDLTLYTDSANTILYTLDHSDPLGDSAQTYLGGISMVRSAKLRLVIRNDRVDSELMEFTYVIGDEQPPGELQEFTATASTRYDTAEEYAANGTMTSNHDLRIGGYRSTSLLAANQMRVAVRFVNVSLPADAIIEDAYIEFTTKDRKTGTHSANIEVRTELGSPAAYTTTKYNISSRSYSSMAVRYTQPTLATAKQVVRTAGLQGLIDENRLSGWQNGQAMAFLLDGDNFIGSAYQGGTAYPPKLVIRYRIGGGPNIGGAVTDPEKIRNVYINEVSAAGTSKSKETWVELYNDNSFPVVLGAGTYLSHNAKKPETFEFSNLLIPAKGYRIVYCDKKTELGNDHASFEVKSSGDVVLSAKENGQTIPLDTLSYDKHLYNHTYGRRTDGTGETVQFARETFEASNNSGFELYELDMSHDRGVYDSGFTLSIASRPGAVIKYTTDGSTPGNLHGTTYSGPISIYKSCIVKVYAYDDKGNSGAVPFTYVLKNNYANEVKSSHSRWNYKSTITSQEYAEAIGQLPIFSISSDTTSFNKNTYDLAQFEFLDSHLGGENFHADVGARKFGQVSASQFNSNMAVRFKRDYNSTKAKYPFFTESVENDPYPTIGKYARLDIKEGQDGPQNDIYNLGYMRYNESMVGTLAKQMGKIGLATRYVHYFFNGEYRGVKTMREHFNDNLFEDVIGGDSDDYTKIRFQDGSFVPGKVEEGDGDVAMLRKVKSIASAKDFQQFKEYVDVDDFIRTQILYMFVDTEREIDAVIHNDAGSGGARMMFNINDTDGAFNNDKKTGTSQSGYAGGGGTYRHKWNSDSTSRNGPGGMFGAFSGNSSSNAAAGNLEFKTLVKDQVLVQLGPVGGDYRGAPGAPLSVDNVQALLRENIQELDAVYKLDAAYMGARSDMYRRWQTENAKILAQVEDRVRFNLQMWSKYHMAHTLEQVKMYDTGSGYILSNQNAGTKTYYTTDGSDPMGPNGVVSSSAQEYREGMTLPTSSQVTVRAFTTNNWGPIAHF